MNLDVALIGAGVSSTYTLLGLVRELRSRGHSAPVKVAIFEQCETTYGGLPYASRTHPRSLIITSLKDFLPVDERAKFAAWLSANKSWAFDRFKEGGGELAAKWLREHQAEMDADDWDPLFLPRYLFGEYLTDTVNRELAESGSEDVIDFEFVNARVDDVSSVGGHYELVLADGRTALADHVVLGLGTPPNGEKLATSEPTVGRVCLIDDPYAGGLGHATDRLSAEMPPAGDSPAKVLILGGNASTMELIFLLNDLGDERLVGAEYHVITLRGSLPPRLLPARSGPPVTTPRLNELSGRKNKTARALYEAALADIDAAVAAGYSITDTLEPVSRAIVPQVSELDRLEQLEFADRWGMELGRYQRRAGSDVWDVVDRLEQQGRFRMIAARYLGLGDISDEGATVCCRGEGGDYLLDDRYAVIINCTGFAPISGRSPALFDRLVAKGMCTPTPSGRGYHVSESMEIQDRLYVNGPFLAGNIVLGAPVWHMEHAGRCMTHGYRLAGQIANRLATRVTCSE